MERCPDADVVTAFCQGRDDALEAIFNRYERPLFLFLLGLLRDHHQAEDALQETFVSALSQLDGVDPGRLRGWLFTVAYHEAMLSRRKAEIRRRRFPTQRYLSPTRSTARPREKKPAATPTSSDCCPSASKKSFGCGCSKGSGFVILPRPWVVR